jgi:hypothetical protein
MRVAVDHERSIARGPEVKNRHAHDCGETYVQRPPVIELGAFTDVSATTLQQLSA